MSAEVQTNAYTLYGEYSEKKNTIYIEADGGYWVDLDGNIIDADISTVGAEWGKETIRMNVPCPDCGYIMPQYIRHLVGPTGYSIAWDSREECSCGYKLDYYPV